MFLVSSFDDRMTINAYTRDASIQQAWWRELGKRSWIPPYDDTGRSIVASLARAACEQQSLLAARSPPPPCQFLPWQSCLQDNSIITTCWIYTIMCELWAQLIRVEQPRSLGYERLILYTATSPWILFARVLYDGDSSLTWPSVCIYMAEIYTRLYHAVLWIPWFLRSDAIQNNTIGRRLLLQLCRAWSLACWWRIWVLLVFYGESLNN